MPRPVRRKVTLAVLAFVGVLALAAPALAANAGLTPVEPRSPNAEAINDTYFLILAITGVIFVLVQGSLVLFVVKYRRKHRTREAEGPQVHGNTRLEILWTAIPVLILVFVTGFVFWKLPAIEDVPEARAGDSPNLEIDVDGRRFYWQYTYPDGSITYDTLIVPVDRTVVLHITAPDWDVVHSWWAPALGGKMDAVPGERTRWWFRADREGEYQGRCTEFCGVQHASMGLAVRAVAAEAFESELAALDGRRNGRSAFESACAKCHNVSGPQLIGPTLEGNSLLADREALRELLENGRGEMPPVGRGWSDEQFDALFEFVERIGAQGGG